MDSLTYLKALCNKKSRQFPTCPYCREPLQIITKSFKIEFKTPKVPPLGAKDLKLFDITQKTHLKRYVVCGNCDAKFDYDSFITANYGKALKAIPSAKILLNNFLAEELSKYPPNTSFEVRDVETFCKKVIIRK